MTKVISFQLSVIRGMGVALSVLLSGVALSSQANQQNSQDKVALYDRFFNPKSYLSETELNALLEQILFVREPYFGSWMHKQKEYAKTHGHFFTTEEYRKLEGNPAIGYFYVGNFKWLPNQKAISIEPFAPTTPDTNVIKPEAWQTAASLVCKKYGLTQRPDAPIKISGALVAVNLEKPYGVYLEVRVSSPHGTLLYRGGIGKATLGDAVGASLDFIVAYAMGIGDGKPVSKDEARRLLENIQKKSGK